MRPSVIAASAAGWLTMWAACAFAAPAGPMPPGAGYVAMGSSFAAGLGVAERLNGLPTCGRSTHSYGQQLARMRGLALTDNTCSGATTTGILSGGRSGGPQIDGLRPDTRLVTVTIGGNDVRYTADMGRLACANAPDVRPAEQRGTPCPAAPPTDPEADFAALETNLKAIVAQVRQRSPQARLIFVDYVTLVPPRGVTCPALTFTPAQADELRARAERLAALTARVAIEGGAEVLKASALSRGHEICSAAPWSEGLVLKQKPEDFGPAGFHPTLAAHTGIAQALDAMLR